MHEGRTDYDEALLASLEALVGGVPCRRIACSAHCLRYCCGIDGDCHPFAVRRYAHRKSDGLAIPGGRESDRLAVADGSSRNVVADSITDLTCRYVESHSDDKAPAYAVAAGYGKAAYPDGWFLLAA